jgi:hypothetical protein
MTVTESESLKKGARVYWHGNAAEWRYHGYELGCGHDRLGQWAGCQRTPRGDARNSASADKAAQCVEEILFSPDRERAHHVRTVEFQPGRTTP